MVHAVGVLLASVFAFFAVFSVLGLLMAVLPPRAFRRYSAYARGAVVVYLVALLCTTFAVPDALWRAKGTIPSWTFVMPSCWFLGLCQSLRGRAGPVLLELSRLALPGVAAVVGRRALCLRGELPAPLRAHCRDSPTQLATARQRSSIAAGRSCWIACVLRTPFQKAGFRFVWQDLASQRIPSPGSDRRRRTRPGPGLSGSDGCFCRREIVARSGPLAGRSLDPVHSQLS